MFIKSVQAQSSTSGGVNVMSTPGGFTIDLIDGDKVILLWEEVQNNDLEGYIIYKSSKEGEAPEEVDRVAPGTSSFIDEDVVPGLAYTYRVQAYAKGYVGGETDVKSVIISEEINSPIAQTTNTTAEISSQASEILNPNADNFWMNIFAINLVILGLLLFIYLFIRYLLVGFWESRKRKKENKQIDEKIARRKRITFQMKRDDEHPDIVEEAKDQFYAEKGKKLKEWVEKSEEEPPE